MDVSQAKQEHLLALKGVFLPSLQQTDCDLILWMMVIWVVTTANVLSRLTGPTCRFNYKILKDRHLLEWRGCQHSDLRLLCCRLNAPLFTRHTFICCLSKLDLVLDWVEWLNKIIMVTRSLTNASLFYSDEVDQTNTFHKFASDMWRSRPSR